MYLYTVDYFTVMKITIKEFIIPPKKTQITWRRQYKEEKCL